MPKPIKIIPIVIVVGLVLLAAWFEYQAQKARQLTGVVRDAETQTPLDGATLSASGNQATTNARGQYTLDLATGHSTVTVNAEGYLPFERSMNSDDVLARPFEFDIDLVPNHVVGYLLDGDTNRTLANVQFQVGERKYNSDQQGAFELHALKKGTSIAVNLGGYQPASFVFNGESSFNITLAPSVLTVTVTDLAGKPVANAQVQAGNQSSASDAQGRAIFRRVEPGAAVKASIPGFDSASASFAGSDLKIPLRPNTLDGIVTDATTGKPISNTLVYLGKTIVTTNAQGAYHVNNPANPITLTLKAPGYRKTEVPVAGDARRDIKLQPYQVRGIHIPFGMQPDQVRANIDMVRTTDLNAIVLDVKAEKGRVAWDSQVQLAKQIEAPYLKGIDLGEVIKRCRADKIYCIARMPVFQDNRLALARPDLALKSPNGKVYMDNNEQAWTNAADPTVWDYNIALAKEAAALGFDEIQFDYVRFPGQVGVVYTGASNTEQGRIAAISGFLARAQKELRPSGVFVSADVFGLTTAVEDDQHTGQRLSDLGQYVDYVSPMVYPDVWVDAAYLLSKGLGISNCTEANRCPYDVIFNSYKRATEKTTAKVRLWLQAYAGRGNFGIAQYKLQRKAAEDAGNMGWMFWSGVGNYDPKMFGPPEPPGQ